MAYVDNIALRGGAYGGWNYQITPNYVVGVEGNFGWAHESAVLHGSAYPTTFWFSQPSFRSYAPRQLSGHHGLGRQHIAARRHSPHPLHFVLYERWFGLGTRSIYFDLFHYSDRKCVKLCPLQLLFWDTGTR
jgi:hypothetical protein